ncbi:MAG: DUF2231 domain-containing protein [Candidatus Omnitrophica bacterium]|nr:DUF2231 domain-containing protein [Candidatus Omnitrophota bacterium]
MLTKLHPVLVNFTAALIPVSWASDLLARFFKNDPLRSTAWWTLLYATLITPLTVVTGWLFWMPDDNGAAGMAVHKWLGTMLGVLLLVLFSWRWKFYSRQQPVSWGYLAFGLVFVAALIIQGHLGGSQVFSSM